MTFCGISMTLDPVQLEMNLDVIRFLCEHGADKTLLSKPKAPNITSPGLTAYEMSAYHCASAKVKQILNETKQIFFHTKIEKQNITGASGRRDGPQAGSILLDDSKIKVGCCSLLYFCKSNPTLINNNS